MMRKAEGASGRAAYGRRVPAYLTCQEFTSPPLEGLPGWSIGPLRANDLEGANSLMNRTFGPAGDWFDHASLDGPDLVLVVRDGYRIGAVASAWIGSDSRLLYETDYRFDLCQAMGALGLERVGFVSGLAVASDLQGRGIGGVLLDLRLRWLAESGARLVCAMAWETADGACRSLRLLESRGLRQVARCPGFWEGEDCAHCGPPMSPHASSCRCSARAMVGSLGQVECLLAA